MNGSCGGVSTEVELLMKKQKLPDTVEGAL